ncbi:acetylcholine receptor subunit beta-type unc-29-like [Saccostrea cucullata]|uniref:acetylcholine receptor subunit beta-type unc-29-like n=1 Tax=Saccostrea cuccullata TaxID=36930 RepID=UPI002ED63339
MSATRIFVIVVFLACISSLTKAYTLKEELNLHAAIFNSTYDTNVRPGENRSIPLQINVTFYFKSIKEVDESISKFSITGALGVMWKDDRLTWEPSNYGEDLYTTIVPQKKIWMPFLVNINAYNELTEIGSSNMDLRIENNGAITWVTPNIFESTCDADMSYYPFDSQTCTLRFYIPGFMPSEITFTIPENSINMHEYSKNSLWDVTNTRMHTALNILQFQEVRMSVTMKRRPVYYVSSLILPVAFLSFLQLFVFLMPPDSGERVGFATTVLLAIAVYLTLVQDKLPEGSEPSVSYLSYKLLGDFMIGVFMVIGVIIGLRFYHREHEQRIPEYLKTLYRISFCDLSCRYLKKHKVNTDEKETMEEMKNTGPLTWQDIGKATDRLCLFMFGFGLMNCNIVYLIVIVSFY